VAGSSLTLNNTIVAGNIPSPGGSYGDIAGNASGS